MNGRLGGTRRKGFATLASVVIAITVGAATESCGGGGDDNAGDAGLDGARDSSASESHDPADARMDSKSADGGAVAVFSPTSTHVLTFATVSCGGAAETVPLTVTNHGSEKLAVSASIAGSGFTVSPAVLQVESGKSGTLTLSATATSSATAGVPFVGALNLFTNDPTQSHLTYQLSATPAGATLAIQPEASFTFPGTAVGAPASALSLTLTNTGNAKGTFTFDAPSNSLFTLSLDGPDGGQLAVTLEPGGAVSAWAGFTPTSTMLASATSIITASGTTCGSSPLSIAFSGAGATGDVTGWPTTVDLGPSNCGGAAPANQTFTVTNTGLVDAHVTTASLTGAPGFTTNVETGLTIAAGGGLLKVTVTGPAVPANSPTTPISATFTVETDADTSPHVIALTEEPSGAILTFDTTSATATPNFGSFGAIQLLESATQSFNVKNAGSAPATITLVASTGGVPADGGTPSSDAGDASPDEADASSGASDASFDAGDASSAGTPSSEAGDASSSAGGPSPFSVAPLTFTIPPNGTQAESATFTPLAVSGVTGNIAMMAATGAICGPLPSPILVSGSGLGGGPTITPSSLPFLATCGSAAPVPQSFVVRNDGTADMTWAMSGPTGPGASQYTVSASPVPGLLIPGTFATVTVTAAAIPSPVSNPAPSAFAAQLSITTDVPLDPTHIVALSETALGDQLSFSTPGPLRFGQIPVNTTLPQNFTLANNANAGSPAATVSFAVSGTGAAGYVAPAAAASLAPGATASEKLVFSPTSDIAYPATLGAVTTDALCTPLPTPLQLSGTGTQGVVSVSAATLTFGTDAKDPMGLVNCGATGLSQTLTVSNVGNQAFQITGLTLGNGATSPYTLSGSGATLPATLPIGGSVMIIVTPSTIPKSVSNPSDATAFSDTLTIVTNAALDTPHPIALVMQARGAVVANTLLATTWSFGTVSLGSIGTFTSTIQNTGNAGISIALQGLGQPTIFGLQSNPTTGAASAVTPIVGQFAPPSSNGSWSDSGTLVVTAQEVFCEPLPTQWNLPTISLSGASNSNPAVSVSGSLAFPTTDCGSAAPAGQAISLGNATNVAYAYKTSLNSGKFYTVSSTSGTIVANGSATIVVTPTTVTPGPGVTPGASPYADDLLVTIATTPPTQLTLPISWALNGAVLTLPSGAGPLIDGSNNPFYPADTTSGFLLPMANSGTAAASVDFAIAPVGAFTFSPLPPTQVIPGIGATPGLVGSASDLVCPAVTVSTATFVYSGPVCQPFSLPKVTVEACFGTF